MSGSSKFTYFVGMKNENYEESLGEIQSIYIKLNVCVCVCVFYSTEFTF